MRRQSLGSVRVFSAPGRDEILARLRASLARLRATLPLQSVYLFGSYARGNYAPGSDVDVLVVYEGGPLEDAYRRAWDALAIPGLQLHIYREEEFQELRRQRPSPLDALLRGALLVWPSQDAHTG